MPHDLKNDPARRNENNATVEIEAIVSPIYKKGIFIPDNNIKDNLWFYIDIDTISHIIDKKLPSLFLRKLYNEKQFGIKSSGIGIKLYNHHLEYVITWYSLSFILLIMFFRNKIKKLFVKIFKSVNI